MIALQSSAQDSQENKKTGLFCFQQFTKCKVSEQYEIMTKEEQHTDRVPAEVWCHQQYLVFTCSRRLFVVFCGFVVKSALNQTEESFVERSGQPAIQPECFIPLCRWSRPMLKHCDSVLQPLSPWFRPFLSRAAWTVDGCSVSATFLRGTWPALTCSLVFISPNAWFYPPDLKNNSNNLCKNSTAKISQHFSSFQKAES